MSKQWVSYIAMVGLGLGLMGCGDDDENGEELERPAESRALVSDEVLEQFQEAGANVYLGMSPPSIAGTYYFGDVNVDYTDSENWPHSNSWCHDRISYAEGDTPFLYEVSSVSTNCDAESEGESNYISGDEGCFTLYGEETFVFEGCQGQSVRIMSSCVADNGDFADPQTTTLNLNLEGDPCESLVEDGRILGDGEIAITVQSDGVATKE